MLAYRGNRLGPRSADKPLLCHCFGVRIRRTLFQTDRLYNTGHRWLTDELPGKRQLTKPTIALCASVDIGRNIA